MRTNYLILAAAIALSHSAFAQNSTTTTSAASDAASAPSAAAVNTSAATSAAPKQTGLLSPAIKYLGYLHGTGLTFSGARQSEVNDEQINYEQRIKFLPISNSAMDLGLEARVNSHFGDGKKMDVGNGAWRLYANFKNVLHNDVYDLSLMPRIVLPTSNKLHNQKATISPDMLAILGINPKNSRFSYTAAIEYIQYFYSDKGLGKDYSNATSVVIAPWFEADYQLTDKTQLNLSYWPSLISRRNGSKLTSAFAQDGGNEFDVGATYEISKAWQVSPFIAIETSDISSKPSALQNMQLNVAVIGRFL